MILIRLLAIVPAFFIGSLVGSLFLGILPTIALDAFITNFHYTIEAQKWVQWAGVAGSIAACSAAIAWAFVYRSESP